MCLYLNWIERYFHISTRLHVHFLLVSNSQDTPHSYTLSNVHVLLANMHRLRYSSVCSFFIPLSFFLFSLQVFGLRESPPHCQNLSDPKTSAQQVSVGVRYACHWVHCRAAWCV